MNITYEIRTTRNTPVMAFDNLDRAKSYIKRFKSLEWRIVRITRVEEEVK